MFCFVFVFYMWVLHQIWSNMRFLLLSSKFLVSSCVSCHFICSLGLTIGWNQPWWDLLKLHLIWTISGGVGKQSKTTSINNCTGVGFHQYTREPLLQLSVFVGFKADVTIMFMGSQLRLKSTLYCSKSRLSLHYHYVSTFVYVPLIFWSTYPPFTLFCHPVTRLKMLVQIFYDTCLTSTNC